MQIAGIQEGEYIDIRVTYPEVNADLRTDINITRHWNGQQYTSRLHALMLYRSNEKDVAILVKRTKKC